MFGGRQRGGGLNDKTSTIEWIAFNRRIRHGRNLIMSSADKLHKVVTGLAGNKGTALAKIVDNDLEMRRIETESLKMKAEAYGAIKEVGIFTQEELRQKFVDPNPNWNDLPAELPKELKQQMQSMQQMQGAM